MGMTKRACRAVLPFAAVLMGTAMPGAAVAERAATEQTASRPDWLLLAVAGVALVMGRLVIPRISRRSRKPR